MGEKSQAELLFELQELKKENESLKAIVEQYRSEREPRFRQFLSDVPTIAVQGYAPDGTTQYWNEASERLYGYAAEEAIGRNLLELIIPPEMQDGVKQAIRFMAETGEAIPSGELLLARKDGSRVPVFSSQTLVKIPGRVQELFCMDIDLSEHKRGEAALRESEHRLARAEKAAKFGNWKLLLQTKQMLSSVGARILYGVEEDTISLEDIQKIPLPEFRAYLDKALEDLIKYDIPYDVEFKICRPNDGRIIDIHSIADYDRENNIVFGVIQDITEKKSVETALRESEEKFRILFEGAPDAIFLADPDTGRILDANKSSCRLLNKTRDAIIGLHQSELHPPQNENFSTKSFEQHLIESVEDGYTRPIENTIIRSDGGSVPVEVIAKTISFQNRKVLMGTFRDISERKRTEAEIQKKNAELAELNASKDKFFSIIAHDLKSPFAGFLGLTKIMAEELPNLTMKEMHEFSISLQDSAKNLYKLLENLLEWARMQRGVTEFNPEWCFPFFIVNQILDVQAEVAKQKNIQIENLIPQETTVFADIPMLHTLFRNLLSNAIKFTPRGGKIIVEVNDFDETKNCFCVRDNGIGMNNETIAELFKIGQKVSRPGTEGEPSTGLGLLLCKEFVEKNGGRIWVESKENKGSTFCFTLLKNLTDS